jgi:ribonucleotide reductase alpha subunit
MENNYEMKVKKRNGNLEDISFDKILNRIKKLGQEAGVQINYSSLAMKVIDQLYDNIETTKIDELAAEQCASLSTQHPDYATLSSRIVVSNHQKNTEKLFSKVITKLYEFKDVHGINKPLISQQMFDFISLYSDILDKMIDHNRDYLIDYFGFKTLERAYLFRLNGIIIERIQHMWLRVSVGIHLDLKDPMNSLKLINETYDLMSLKYFTHATPTLFNAGTPRPQLSSCYLIAMEDDSIEGIFNTLKECAHISKWAGGVGLHIHNIRAKGSHIQGTNGTSNGIVPMLRVFNNTARYVDQGGNKRNGSFAIYLEPWHPDIEDFLEMKKNHGDEELKARDLFYALWISDLFMERVKENGKWNYFCPHECPGLSDLYGKEFNTLYEKYENEGKSRKTVNARDLWFKILDSQMETGTPYLLYKDAVNNKSNQKNLGTIKSSNLCVAPETLILTDEGYIEIQKLVGKEINVWNGQEWSKVTVKKTGINQKVIRVSVNIENSTYNFRQLRCTPYHKFYINDYNDLGNKLVKEIEAKDLKLGMELIGFNKPTDYNINKELSNVSYDGWPCYKYAKITSLQDLHESCDTYCFTEPKRHMGIFNGIITGQCTEITEYSDENETAVCNLASIALPSFVDIKTKQFDYDKLHSVTKVVTNNLNKVIDINFYPTEKTRRSNMRHRPIGIGVQGLADTFILMDIPFQSEEAKEVNKLIFETIYHASLERSNEISIERKEALNNTENDIKITEEETTKLKQEHKGAYSSFTDSPISNGIFQFDMWNVKPSERYDWNKLRNSIIYHGIRNSLLVAPMPTASTSQILGFNECFEPFTSNIYTRRTLAGEFVIVNKYLIKELIDMNLWNDKIKNNIIANKGSIQQLTMLSEHMRNKYKIVWEIPMKHIIDMAADRGAFICQSQSLNLWIEDPAYNTLTSMHFYSWKKGLKTGIYYLRRKAKHQAQQFTIEPETKEIQNNDEHDEICEMCSA